MSKSVAKKVQGQGVHWPTAFDAVVALAARFRVMTLTLAAQGKWSDTVHYESDDGPQPVELHASIARSSNTGLALHLTSATAIVARQIARDALAIVESGGREIRFKARDDRGPIQLLLEVKLGAQKSAPPPSLPVKTKPRPRKPDAVEVVADPDPDWRPGPFAYTPTPAPSAPIESTQPEDSE